MTVTGRSISEQSIVQSRSRTLVKTVLYRAFMLAITVGVALFVTGDTGQALNIGVAANVMKTGTYYAYDRLWARLSWGLKEPDPPTN